MVMREEEDWRHVQIRMDCIVNGCEGKDAFSYALAIEMIQMICLAAAETIVGYQLQNNLHVLSLRQRAHARTGYVVCTITDAYSQ